MTRDQSRSDFPVITPKPFQLRPHPEDEPLNDFQKGVLALVAGVSAFNRIDHGQHPTAKVAALARLVEDEARIPRLKTIGQAWQYMKEKLDSTFQ